jgi:hypothetical protein
MRYYVNPVAIKKPASHFASDLHKVFLETDSFDTKALMSQLKGKLPVYMLLRNVLVLHRFPLNANGKYDRKALQLILEDRFGLDQSRAAIPLPLGDAVESEFRSGNQQPRSKLASLLAASAGTYCSTHP